MLTLCLFHNTYFSRQGTPTLRQNCAITPEIRRISQTGKEALTHLHDTAYTGRVFSVTAATHTWSATTITGSATCSHLPQEQG